MLHKSSLTILPKYVLLFSIIHVHFLKFTCYIFLLTLCSFPTPPASLLASWGQRQHLFATAVQLRITSPHTGTVHSCCSVPQLCRTLWDPVTAARQASLSLTISQSLPKFMSLHQYAIQPSHPLTRSSLSALNLSHHQGLFQWAGYLHWMTSMLEFQL